MSKTSQRKASKRQKIEKIKKCLSTGKMPPYRFYTDKEWKIARYESNKYWREL